jgi:hypothetical protein
MFLFGATGSFLVLIIGGAVGLVCWIFGIMALFEKTFGQAFFLMLACEALEWILGNTISAALIAFGYGGSKVSLVPFSVNQITWAQTIRNFASSSAATPECITRNTEIPRTDARKRRPELTEAEKNIPSILSKGC